MLAYFTIVKKAWQWWTLNACIFHHCQKSLTMVNIKCLHFTIVKKSLTMVNILHFTIVKKSWYNTTFIISKFASIQHIQLLANIFTSKFDTKWQNKNFLTKSKACQFLKTVLLMQSSMANCQALLRLQMMLNILAQIASSNCQASTLQLQFATL